MKSMNDSKLLFDFTDLGVNWFIRKWAAHAPFGLEIIQDGDNFSLILDSMKIKQRDDFVLDTRKDVKEHFGNAHTVPPNNLPTHRIELLFIFFTYVIT